MSAAQKGKKGAPHSPETRAKIGAASKGKTLSFEHRARIGAAQKGKTLSPEHRAKIRLARIGKTHSPETRANMSAAQRSRWAAQRLAAGAEKRPQVIETEGFSDASL
mgnify:CR=1 FL=1